MARATIFSSILMRFLNEFDIADIHRTYGDYYKSVRYRDPVARLRLVLCHTHHSQLSLASAINNRKWVWRSAHTQTHLKLAWSCQKCTMKYVSHQTFASTHTVNRHTLYACYHFCCEKHTTNHPAKVRSLCLGVSPMSRRICHCEPIVSIKLFDVMEL